jgi:hypothetical protein
MNGAVIALGPISGARHAMFWISCGECMIDRFGLFWVVNMNRVLWSASFPILLYKMVLSKLASCWENQKAPWAYFGKYSYMGLLPSHTKECF